MLYSFDCYLRPRREVIPQFDVELAEVSQLPDVRCLWLMGLSSQKARDIVSVAVLHSMNSGIPYTKVIDGIKQAMAQR